MNPEGIDVAAAMAHVAKHRNLGGFGGAQEVAPDALLTTECDVLLPAALGGVISEDGSHDAAEVAGQVLKGKGGRGSGRGRIAAAWAAQFRRGRSPSLLRDHHGTTMAPWRGSSAYLK